MDEEVLPLGAALHASMAFEGIKRAANQDLMHEEL